jgi:hypothetical protein
MKPLHVLYQRESHYRRQGGRWGCADCEQLLAIAGEPEEWFGRTLLPCSVLEDGRARCPACCVASNIPTRRQPHDGTMVMRIPGGKGWESAAEIAYGGKVRRGET